jgi:hypothetical protein
MDKYLFLSLRVDYRNGNEPWYGNDVTEGSLSEYVLTGDLYSMDGKTTILHVHEISKSEYEVLNKKYENE